jgi:hypothetical protein
MEWTIDYVEAEDVVLVKTYGVITLDGIKQMCEDIVSFARKYNTHKIFVDNCDLKSSLPLLQVDGIPEMLKEIGFVPEDEIAVLYDEGRENKYKFFQSVSNIASLNLQIFTNWDEAMEWLKSAKLQQSMLLLQ